MNEMKPIRVDAAPPAKRSFAAMRHRGFRAQFTTYVLAMMADNIEHVISYWVVFQKFHSPALGGFAIVSHWLPFLLFSVVSGALADDRIVVVSDGTHLFRIELLCRRAGLDVYTSPRAPLGHIDGLDAAQRVWHEMLSYTLWRLKIH